MQIDAGSRTPPEPPGRRRAHEPDPIPSTAAFYTALAPFFAFGGIADPACFVPLPDDWVIGLADVVASTDAIAAGGYKTVNTAGAAVISAVSNALGTLDFPFLFGGDGASFAVGPLDAELASQALAATVAWVGKELGLVLRGAVIPVAAIRANGLDVRVARFSVSPDVTYAMFAGGGLAWAEARLKAGDLALPPAPPHAQPDLTGLSCRFQDIQAKHGVILSLLVRPAGTADDPRFRELVTTLLALVEQGPDAARPIPVFKPMGGIRLRSIAINARLLRRPGQTGLGTFLKAAKDSILACVVLGAGMTIGGFSAKSYLREVVANSDFRKYDDGLMMTLDCDADLADRIARHLDEGERAGIVNYGLHRQGSATITCVVPSAMQSNHVHFIDGGSGGYAMAARDLKSRLKIA